MRIFNFNTIKTGIYNCANAVKTGLHLNSKNIFKKDAIDNLDTFCKESYAKKILHYANDDYKRYIYKNIFRNIDSFTEADYKKLSKEELGAIRANISVDVAEDAENIVNSASTIKNLFDNKYGKDGYVFISVGRSFSPIANCMKKMGADAMSIPISGLANHTEKGVTAEIIKQSGFKKYKHYLYNLGLGEKSDKKLLFCDLTLSGATLKTFQKIIEHPIVGLKSKNNLFIRLNKELDKFTDSNNTKVSKELNKLCFNIMGKKYKKYAEVDNLNYLHLKFIDQAAKQPSTEIANKMRFCILDILNSQPKL